MKEKKKIITVAIILILALVIIFIGVFFIIRNNSNKSFFDYPESERKTISNCKNDSCEISDVDYYDKIVLNKKYDALEKKIDKINKDTEKYYKLVNESDTNSSECFAVKDVYNHRYRSVFDFVNYDNKNYVSISISRINYDLCRNTIDYKPTESYIYDKKEKKIISQEEFKLREMITDKDIKQAIEATIKIIENDVSGKIELQDSYDDAIVFFGNDGEILVSFYVKEAKAYYTATLRENTDSK